MFNVFDQGKPYTELAGRVLQDQNQLTYCTRVLHTFYFEEPFCSWIEDRLNHDTLWLLEQAVWPAAIQTVGRLIERNTGTASEPRFNLESLLAVYASNSIASAPALKKQLDSFRSEPEIQTLLHYRHILTAHSGVDSKPARQLRSQNLFMNMTRGDAIMEFVRVVCAARHFLCAGSANHSLPNLDFSSNPETRAQQLVCRLYHSLRDHTHDSWSKITGRENPYALW